MLAIATDASWQSPSTPSRIQANIASGPSTPYVTMFQIQQNSSDPSPLLVAPVSDKSVWIVTEGFGKHAFSQLVNFTVGAGFERVATLPNSFPSDLIYDNITTDNNKRVWILENNSLAYYNPTSRNITVAETFPGSPWYMTIDHNDHFWITLTGPDRIVEYHHGGIPVYHNITNSCDIATYGCGLQGIALDPRDDSLWFAETYVGSIGHMTCNPSSQCSMSEYDPPSGLDTAGLIQVAVDESGLVWFTLHDGNEFGNLNPTTKEWRVFPIGYCPDSYVNGCATGLPNAIFLDSRGQIWFSEHIAGRVATLVPGSGGGTPNYGTLVEYNLPTYSTVCPRRCTPLVWWMRPGPGNLIWFISYGMGEIGYVNATMPIPFSVVSQSEVNVVQGESVKIPVSTRYSVDFPSLNVSITRTESIANPPMLSWSIGPRRYSSIGGTENSTITLFAAWSSTLDSRYVAISAYDENVTVNTFVRVDVLPSLIVYSTVGVAGGISAFSLVSVGIPLLSTMRKRRKPTGSSSRE